MGRWGFLAADMVVHLSYAMLIGVAVGWMVFVVSAMPELMMC